MDLFWRVTYDDIKIKVRLYLNHQQALIAQQFQTFAKVASLALGPGPGSKEGTKKSETPPVKQPQSFEELAGMMGMFRG